MSIRIIASRFSQFVVTFACFILSCCTVAFWAPASVAQDASSESLEARHADNANDSFEATVESLKRYECPEWFRDAKFGIWSHWTGYVVAGQGDWYARNMYIQGHPHYKYHVKTYGHPSKFGYKDLIELWDVDRWDPDEQMRLFKKAGAKYFVALANHHDNFDLWDSKHQPWNSVNFGPKRDIVGQWRQAALKHQMRWGVTSHLERTWSWFQVAKGSDKTGELKGVPYDGADPKNVDIYLPAEPTGDTNKAQPKNATPWWRKHWLARCKDLVETHRPDLFYVDGGVPFPGDDRGATGLEFIAHFYNENTRWHHGSNQAVMCLKNWLHVAPDGAWGYYWDGIGTQDCERTRLRDIQTEPWQTDTSIGGWSWKASDRYRTTTQIIHELVDIVSKNGNLLLNIPQRADGSLDDRSLNFLREMAQWMEVNGDSIHGTRPWQIWGKGRLRIVKKQNRLFLTSFDWPETGTIQADFIQAGQVPSIRRVRLLGHEAPIEFELSESGLSIELPDEQKGAHAWVFEIELPDSAAVDAN